MRAMKKKLQREGIFKEMKQRRAYEKPSEKKARLLNECTRRYKKMLRKKADLSPLKNIIGSIDIIIIFCSPVEKFFPSLLLFFS